MQRVLILGADGLLGTSISRAFREPDFEIFSTVREKKTLPEHSSSLYFSLDQSIERLINEINPSIVINCIANKSHARLFSRDFSKQIITNSQFPHQINRLSQKLGFFFFHFSSDVVFPGIKPQYSERDLPLPLTAYGVSKLFGEFSSDNSLVLRFSAVASQANENHKKNHLSGRILTAPRHGRLEGNIRRNWNGLTMELIAETILKLSRANFPIHGLRHFYSREAISQYELIQLLANRFNRHDLVITPKMRIRAGSILKSAYEDEHEYLWSLLGFKKVPSIRELI